jgi:hypothetical protein
MTMGLDSAGAMEFAAISRVLHDDKATLAVFDQLPKGDWRRDKLAIAAFQLLVAERRYADALTGRSYSSMIALFDVRKKERPLPAGTRDAEAKRKRDRESLINSTAENVEVVAGASELEDARQLAGRLLRFDSSAEAKAILQQHLERAGHPELLSTPTP